MRVKRINEMMSYIQEHKTVTIEQLCDQFDISVNTVRRDINEITQNEQFKKTYGGITCESELTLKPFNERHVKNLSAKQQIARKAAELVNDGDTIFIDSGTTTYHMIDFLKYKVGVTILTHNLEAITRAAQYPNLHIVSLPGDLNHKTLSFTGINTAHYLSAYNINKSFIATSGLSAARGITNSSPQEYEIKRMAISRTQTNYVLADYNKFNNVSLLTFNTFEQIHAIITEQYPDEELREYLVMKKIELITC